MVRIWKQDRKEAAPGSAPPAIVPIVLYHGKRPWPYSTQFADWLRIRDELREVLAPFQPDFKHVLMDLGQMPMEAIKGRLMTRLALSLMKAVQDSTVLEWLERFGQLLLEFSREEEMMGQFRAMLRYLFQAEASAPSTFRDLASKVENTYKTGRYDNRRATEAGRPSGRRGDGADSKLSGIAEPSGERG
jgi:hypothetical protein